MNLLTKIGLYAVAIVALIGIAWAFKVNYDAAIESQALAKYNNKQLQLVIENAHETMEITRNMQNSLNEVQKTLNETNAEEDEKTSEIKDRLAQSEGSDKLSSQVLKDAVRELSTRNGN